MGHHCYGDADAGDPNRDGRVLVSRVGVVFSNVTRHSGYLETVTVYFEGQERQIMGSVDGFGRGTGTSPSTTTASTTPAPRSRCPSTSRSNSTTTKAVKMSASTTSDTRRRRASPALPAPEVTPEGRHPPVSRPTAKRCTTSSWR
jgi:hypothetical protein